MRISDWSSDVCSSDLVSATRAALLTLAGSDRLGCAIGAAAALLLDWDGVSEALAGIAQRLGADAGQRHQSWPSPAETMRMAETAAALPGGERAVRFGFQTLLAQHRAFWNIVQRSEEHTSELQSLMRISYAVFCLQKKTLFYIY